MSASLHNPVTHTESDVTLRLVEVWFDSTWAYLMSPQQMVKRVDHHRKHVSDTASVASSIAEGSVVGKSVNEKIKVLHEALQMVHERLRYQDFKDLCACCLKSSDRLYPGFKDILLIVRHLLREDPTYRDKLHAKEIEKITLPMIYQCIYYQFCDYLLRTSRGSEAMKLLTTPTKLTHATYDICRQKFCRLMVDETDIVQYGLLRLIRKLIKYRQRSHSKPAVVLPPPPPTPVQSPAPVPVVDPYPAEYKLTPKYKPPPPPLVDPAAPDVDVDSETSSSSSDDRPLPPYLIPQAAVKAARDLEEETSGSSESDDDTDALDVSRNAREPYTTGPFYSPYGIPRADVRQKAPVKKMTLPTPPRVKEEDDSVSSLEDDDHYRQRS